MRWLRGACALALATLVACGSSNDTTPPPASSGTEAVNQRFTGTLSDGSLVTLDFGTVGQAIRSTASVARRADAASSAIAVTGTVTRPDGSTVALSGTYDPETKQFSITGGDYAFSGTYDGGAIQAQATVGGVPVKLVAVMGTTSAATRYCGTFTTAKQETGTFNIVVSGAHAFGVAEGGVAFSGTVTGSKIAMKDDRGTPISATVADGAVSGTFTNADGLGTFSGSTAACDAILAPPACLYTYSDWGACQSDKTQTRTVVSATPEGCTGTPVLTRSCSVEPPPALECAAPATNPASPSTEKDSTTSSGPPPAGGTISPGTYDLWNTVYYAQSADTSTSPSTDRRRFVLSADGTLEVIVSDETSVGRFLGTYVVDPANKTLTITVTCSSNPAAQPVGSVLGPIPYTVDTWSVQGATLLKLYTTSHTGLPKEEAYKLQ